VIAFLTSYWSIAAPRRRFGGERGTSMIGLRRRDDVGARRHAPLLSSCAYRPKNGRLDGEARRPRAVQNRSLRGQIRRPLRCSNCYASSRGQRCIGCLIGRLEA
jgi:hypothetical protein